MVSYLKNGLADIALGRTFSTIELLPAAELRALQQQRFLDQVRYLEERSVFYQRKLADAGVAWNELVDLDSLSCIPFTTKQELRDSMAEAPPFGLHLAAHPSEVVQMQASSGTTGSPSYVALTEPDVIQWNESTARCLFAAGVRPGDRVLHGWSLSKGFVGGIPVFQAIQYMGALDVPIGADGGLDRLLTACLDLRPRALVGPPNFLAHLGEAASEVIGVPACELGIERLAVGGEPGGSNPSMRRHLEELWGATSCEMMGGTDLGVIYFSECEHRRGMHLVAPDFVYCELVDPAGAVLPFAPGGQGELVYTALGRQASPLLRFRSGDLVEVLDLACACGRTGPLIRCFGRTDDMLIVRGINLFPSAIQDVIGDLKPSASGAIRVIADFPGHSTQENLKILIERGPAASPSNDAELKTEAERRVRNRLSVKVDARIIPHGRLEKPGAKKVALTLRSMPDV